MITLRWAQLPNVVVTNYNLYRSIIGFRAPISPDLPSLTLLLKLNGGDTQTFVFDGGSPTDLINATIEDGVASLSDDETHFFVRASTSVEIVGGTALGLLSQTPRVITAKSETELLATIPPDEDPLQALSYEDPDGTIDDYYAISTVDESLVESTLTDLIKPTSASGPICVITGTISDLQGNRVVDAKVTASVETFPQGMPPAGITKDAIEVLTDVSGSFRLALLQGALVRLEVPAIGYARMITVPEKTTIEFSELLVDEDYELSDVNG